MDDYNRGGHLKYRMKAHLIFVTKYRKKIFESDTRADDIKQFLYDATQTYGHKIVQMETDKDHVHILLEYNSKISIAEIIRQLKQYSTVQYSTVQYSTYHMWQHPRKYLSEQYWKHTTLWSDGYFVCSIGQVSQEIIEKYIQNQG